MHQIAASGETWQTIHASDGSADAVFDLADPAVTALDAAQSAYLTYLEGWPELNSNAADYQNTYQAYFDNWYDSDIYCGVLMGVQALPRDIGGLSPNEEYIERSEAAPGGFGAAGF